ncbi:hypothetical protein H8B02_12135 [Bradyrhizobium sp. Pear77]|nr:hypothetical protein [Bradyrhizobium altum]MCC8954174.1 hypothetical protein [Bradyrhizobium altum]
MSVMRGVAWRGVSSQMAIPRVLSSYPGGRASVAELKRDLAILNSSGPE